MLLGDKKPFLLLFENKNAWLLIKKWAYLYFAKSNHPLGSEPHGYYWNLVDGGGMVAGVVGAGCAVTDSNGGRFNSSAESMDKCLFN